MSSLSKAHSDILNCLPFVYVDRYIYTSEAAELRERQLAATLDDGDLFDLPNDTTYRLSRTHRKNGFGLKTEVRIPAGQPVCVLYGEKLLPAEAVGSSFKTVETPSGQIISFEKKAGISYYVTGSCKPTLVLKWVWSGGKEFGVFFTIKVTPAGTDLTADFLYILRHDERNAVCDCGDRNCRVGLAAKLPKPKTLCILCPGKTFQNKKQALQHRIVDHIYRGVMPCQYKLCTLWFRSFSGYEKHLRNAHASDILNELTGRENYNKYLCPNMCGFVGDKPMITITHLQGCYAVPPSILNRGLQPQVDAQQMNEGTGDSEVEKEAGALCLPSPSERLVSPPAFVDGEDCRPRRSARGALSSSLVLGPNTSVTCASPTTSHRSKTPSPSLKSSTTKSPAVTCEERMITPPTLSPCRSIQASPSPTRTNTHSPSFPGPGMEHNPSPARRSVTPPSSPGLRIQSAPNAARVSTSLPISPGRHLQQSSIALRSNASPPSSPSSNAQNATIAAVSGCHDLSLGSAIWEACRAGDAEALINILRKVYRDTQLARGVPEKNIVFNEAQCRLLAIAAVENQPTQHVFSATPPPPFPRQLVISSTATPSPVQPMLPSRTAPPVRRSASASPESPRRINTDYVPDLMNEVMPRKTKKTEKKITSMSATKELDRLLAGAEQRNLDQERAKGKAAASPETGSPEIVWTSGVTKRQKKDDKDTEDIGMFMPSESANARYLCDATRRQDRRDEGDDGSAGMAC